MVWATLLCKVESGRVKGEWMEKGERETERDERGRKGDRSVGGAIGRDRHRRQDERRRDLSGVRTPPSRSMVRRDKSAELAGTGGRKNRRTMSVIIPPTSFHSRASNDVRSCEPSFVSSSFEGREEKKDAPSRPPRPPSGAPNSTPRLES